MAVRRARSATLVAAIAWLSGGCGARTQDAHPVPVPVVSAAPSSAPAPAMSAAALVPSLEALAARQLRVAPGMRELARGELSPGFPLPSVTRDTCVRVAFAAAAPVRVSLVASDKTVLAMDTKADGLLDVRGPVCFRVDDRPELRVDGEGGIVRYVVWASP